MEYILDADWVINALARRRNAAALTKQLGPSGIGISIVTVGEVYEGAFAFPHPQEHLASLRRFLAPFDILALSDSLMEEFARLRAHLRQRGDLIPDFDLVIAATALTKDLTVLTFNVRHFQRIPNLKLFPIP